MRWPWYERERSGKGREVRFSSWSLGGRKGGAREEEVEKSRERWFRDNGGIFSDFFLNREIWEIYNLLDLGERQVGGKGDGTGGLVASLVSLCCLPLPSLELLGNMNPVI